MTSLYVYHGSNLSPTRLDRVIRVIRLIRLARLTSLIIPSSQAYIPDEATDLLSASQGPHWGVNRPDYILFT
jgi:hypothetical protein